MTMLLAEQHEFDRQRHKLVIEGVCGDCRSK
jgi:Fe2+ or Zn2+ uptake regulation protein